MLPTKLRTALLAQAIRTSRSKLFSSQISRQPLVATKPRLLNSYTTQASRPSVRPSSRLGCTPQSPILSHLKRTPRIQQRNRATYQTFGAAVAANAFQRWAARPTFYYEVAGISTIVFGVYLYNQEDVPVTGRRRFNIISDAHEKELADNQYRAIMQEYRGAVLDDWDPRTRQVRRVMERLIPSSGLADQAWEVTVIDSQEANAFVIPGGKVFVFTGILPLCKDDNGLAAVLGHEIAHNVAHHTAEQLSSNALLVAAVWAIELLGFAPHQLSQLSLAIAFQWPASRMMESEADHIGLLIMAESCYDPRGAVQMWKRMEEYEKSHGTVPELLSTHPSSHNRQLHLDQLMSQAMDRMEDAGCSYTRGMMDDFRQGGAMQRFS